MHLPHKTRKHIKLQKQTSYINYYIDIVRFSTHTLNVFFWERFAVFYIITSNEYKLVLTILIFANLSDQCVLANFSFILYFRIYFSCNGCDIIQETNKLYLYKYIYSVKPYSNVLKFYKN